MIPIAMRGLKRREALAPALAAPAPPKGGTEKPVLCLVTKHLPRLG